MNIEKFKNGRSLDVGTGMLVSCRMTESGTVVTKSIRDAFLELTPINKLVGATMKKGLTRANINFFEIDDKFYVLGDDSLIQSIERQTVIQRPMSKGVISATEIKALPMFKALLNELLGPPQVENEKIIFTLPGAPIDAKFDVMYHEAVIEHILRELGYSGKALNEAHAIIFSELEDEDFTGLSLSFGSGMVNIGICNLADLVHKFSIAKSGDYIDESTALALGYDPNNLKNNEITPNLITFIKEQGVDLLATDLTDRVKIGIIAHYKNLIRYVVDNLITELKTKKVSVKFTKPIVIVVAGGTSLAGGFIEVFSQELLSRKTELPFEIKEIRHSKQALTAVAQGCLLALQSEV